MHTTIDPKNIKSKSTISEPFVETFSGNGYIGTCAGCRSKIRETKEFKDAWQGCNLQTSDHGVLKRSEVFQIVRDSSFIQTAFLKEHFCSFCVIEYHVKLASHLVKNHAGKFNIKYNSLG